jgi:hypothetical protein
MIAWLKNRTEAHKKNKNKKENQTSVTGIDLWYETGLQEYVNSIIAKRQIRAGYEWVAYYPEGKFLLYLFLYWLNPQQQQLVLHLNSGT